MRAVADARGSLAPEAYGAGLKADGQRSLQGREGLGSFVAFWAIGLAFVHSWIAEALYAAGKKTNRSSGIIHRPRIIERLASHAAIFGMSHQ
jgi:hypothetical protein